MTDIGGETQELIQPFEVAVILGEDSIVDIQVTDIGGETQELIQTVIDNLIPRIKSNQSLAVDSITGATASSGGVKTAVKNAIDEAGGIGGETQEIIQTVIDNLIPRIKSNQSLAVDSITGATASSGGVKTAVKKAIDEAGGDSSEWLTLLPVQLHLQVV